MKPAQKPDECGCGHCSEIVRHASSCAVHNAPALPVGQCDCGMKQRMAFKPYCEKCKTWHTEVEGHVGWTQDELDADYEPPFICPVTAQPCTTEQNEFCEDYGCAREAGIDVDGEWS